MASGERLNLIMQVAGMFCDQAMSKVSIAKEIGKSDSTVTRLLQEAFEKGYVKKKFVLDPPKVFLLERQLSSRFPFLKGVIVVRTGDDYNFQLKTLGATAAKYFDQCIKGRADLKVGISGGRTLHEMVRALPRQQRRITLCPTALIGIGPFVLAHIDPMFLISQLWQKSGRVERTAYSATIEPFAPKSRSKSQWLKEYRSYRQDLEKNKHVRRVWNAMREVDMVFASVGSMPPPPEYQRGATILELLRDIGVTEEALEKDGVVGDISYEFFDRDGNTKPQWDFFLTLDVDHYRRMSLDSEKRVVIIAAGKSKVDALRALLKGKLCNVLITDSTTAEDLLEGG